jgi:heptosyltransferase I
MLTAVGDVVHTLPVVNSLRAAAPALHLSWVVQPGPAGLLAGHPAVDELIAFDRRRGWRAWGELRANLRRRRFDLVLDLQVYLKAGLITRLLRSPRKVGFDRARARDLNWLFSTERIAPGPRAHIQDELLEFVDHLGVPRRLEWRVGTTSEERERYDSLLPPSVHPTVALVVGTSKPEKEWPAERYAAIADRLAVERGARTILVGGRSPREDAAAHTIGRLAAHPPLDLREWDLRRVVRLLERADVLVSPDTGPLHLGVALGTPTVALMGYTNPKRFGPYGHFEELLIDAYGDPGEEYATGAPHRPGRMERIAAGEVVDRVLLALERYPKVPADSGQPPP